MGSASSPLSKRIIILQSDLAFKLCAMRAHIGKGILREKQRLRRERSGDRMELVDGSAHEAAIAFSKKLKGLNQRI
jgi:hypothetical protein